MQKFLTVLAALALSLVTGVVAFLALVVVLAISGYVQPPTQF